MLFLYSNELCFVCVFRVCSIPLCFNLPCFGRINWVLVMVPVSHLFPLCFLPSAYLSGEAFVRYLHLDKEPTDPGECVHVCVHGIYCVCVCVSI